MSYHDNKTFNWTSGNDASGVLGINLGSDIPPYVVNQASVYLRLGRQVDVLSKNVYNDSVAGKLNYSNGDGNSTYFIDGEHAGLYETDVSGTPQLRKGFSFQMPENVTGTDFGRLKLQMSVSEHRGDRGEVLEVSVYNNSSSSYVSCGNVTTGQLSCSFQDGDHFVSGNDLRVLFTDNKSSGTENSSWWSVDRIAAEVRYTNPQNPTYSYGAGFLNRSGSDVTARFDPGRKSSSHLLSFGGQGVLHENGDIQGEITYNRSRLQSYTALQELYIDLYRVELNYSESSIANYTVGIKDGSGSLLDVNYTVFDGGNVFGEFSSFGQSYSERLAENHSYSIRQSIPVFDRSYNVTFHGMNLSGDRSPETQLVNYSGGISVENVSKIYAVNDTSLDYREAQLEIPERKGSPNAIIHCTAWNFTNSTCNSWQINDTTDYPFQERNGSVEFNVTGFDAYGTATGSPLPNITEVRVYDVENAADTRQGGTLVASGLNQTLNIKQQQKTRQYRFEFVVKNQGDVNWNITEGDSLQHSGLNSSWSPVEIWYNTSGRRYGGTFSNGTIHWNTSRGGVLDDAQGNNTMWAKYIVNVTTVSPGEYRERFEVNDSSTGSGSFDVHSLNITKYGYLNVSLQEPPDGTTVLQNTTFTMNATVRCIQGICGKVNVSARYNKSSTADTLIPEGSGRPFHTNNTNTQRCGKLSTGEKCFNAWDVNATGRLNSIHLVDVNSSSAHPEIPGNDSRDARVAIDKAMMIDVGWNRIDFGILNPGATDKPAQGNPAGLYNVTVRDNSATVDSLWVRATDLVAPGWKNPSTGKKYTIPAENVSYAPQNDITVETPLSNSYMLASRNLLPGTNLTTFYWIDVPNGLKTAGYTGKIYFRANATN